MPWHIGKSSECPASKPVAVIKDSDDSVAGCHTSEQGARRQMAALYAQEDMNKSMETIHLKAAVSPTTDQGVFEAVISTQSVDREKDVVVAMAMVHALKQWKRPIPLAWEHSTKAEDIFGHIEPMTVREQDGEVIAQGQVDLETKVGQEAWRSFKNGTMGFSFGYLIPDGGAKAREGGGRYITTLDVYEITATRTPMNNETRVLSAKNTEALRQQAEDIERKMQDAVVEAVAEQLPDEVPQPEPEPESVPEEPLLDPEEVRKQAAKAQRKLQDEAVEAVAEDLPPTNLVEEEPAWAKAIAGLEAQVLALTEQRDTKSPEEVRREAAATEKKLQDEVVEAASKDLPESDPAEEPPPEWMKAIEDLSTKLDTFAARIERQAKSANQPSDPELASLRKTADATALRVLSDGEHLSKPPKKVEEPKPDLPPLGEIRQKSRDVMLAVLSDQPIEEERQNG